MFHVNNTKISHIDRKVVDGVILVLEEYFSEMKVTYRKIHKFLDMIIIY